jgi:S-DNA-T family DNA segregation ATPase FtsK/SpoIIIE
MAYRRKKKGLLGLFGKKTKRGRPRLDAYESRGGFNMDWEISHETKNGIIIIFLFVLAALSLLGLFDLSGGFGKLVVLMLSWMLGSLKWLFPILALLFGYFMLRSDKYQVKIVNYFGASLLILGLTALWHLQFGADGATSAANSGLGGGYAGVVLALPLLKFMGFWGALVVSFAVFIIGVLLTFETSLYGLMWPIKLGKFIYTKIREMTSREESERSKDSEEEDYEEEEEEDVSEEVEEEDEEEEEEEEEPQFGRKSVQATVDPSEEVMAISQPKKFGKKIELPLNLLIGKSGKPTSGDIKANQRIIKQTLANFGINVEMTEVNIGPTVTQYAFRPADGVKLSKITTLNSDLALALAAHPIRIEAPIPGRSLVGIEIPNQQAAKVTMNDILSSNKFKERPSNMMTALGKDVSGKPTFAQIDKMPHLLIAGSTGSGKSVCVNAIITSLLYQNSPDELKFILVDPKRVELPLYNGIPYLLTPVITDVKKTINALKWTITEMERRFEVLSKAGKRNIASYNKSNSDKLPYIVFVIDELADLMSTAANDVEAGVVRLAQMARAVGIHLILATQRPSVEVITGLIKANIPGRIAFSVASLIDSRTILDSSGAENLVGNGDMLYVGPEHSRPKRVQGVFISDKETKNIIDYIKAQGEANYVEGVVEKPSGGGYVGGSGSFDDDGDALLGDAKDVIRESGKASASLLQRRLKIGYARAARILDILEDQGIIGPSDGAKAREIFLERLDGSSADPLEFAAKEHGLTGELRQMDNEEEEGEEDTEEDHDELEEEMEGSEDESEDVVEEETEDDEDTEEEAESEELEENGEAGYDNDEEMEDETDDSQSKKSFADDQWT